MSMRTHHIRLPDEEATRRLAQRLAPVLGAGDVLLLEGGIGAGKTFFARALIQSRLSAAGRSEDVPSPTYTLVQIYDDGTLEMWHADLYRLTSADELTELGLEEAFVTGICLIEWPDRMDLSVLSDPVVLHFTARDDGARDVALHLSDSWAARLQPVLDLADV